MEKIRPNARVETSYGIDGRGSAHDYIVYSCPNCEKEIRKDSENCYNCGTGFDWSKKAHIEYIEKVVWE